VVVDDGSPDSDTHAALDRLTEDGYRVVRLPSNQGVSAARNAGLEATTARYVFPLDADDLAIPGMLGRMADRLDRSPELAVCFGDYTELRLNRVLRSVPERSDPNRVAGASDASPTALLRRATIEALGGWRETGPLRTDSDLWKTFAEQQVPTVHLGPGDLSHRQRTLVD
jgi:glycosyltransferase involved in cell wall biosynthesis